MITDFKENVSFTVKFVVIKHFATVIAARKKTIFTKASFAIFKKMFWLVDALTQLMLTMSRIDADHAC